MSSPIAQYAPPIVPQGERLGKNFLTKQSGETIGNGRFQMEHRKIERRKNRRNLNDHLA
jgi:hypothetical protein